MKKISFVLIALIGAFCLSCSNDPKIEGEFVKAVDEAVAKLENAKTMEEVQAFADEIQKISENEDFQKLSETGAAKLEKAVESMDKKMEEVASSMIDNALSGGNEDSEETTEE